MKFVGVGLRKRSITVCVVDRDRTLLRSRRSACVEVDRIVGSFAGPGPFQDVLEATAGDRGRRERIEPLARRVVAAGRPVRREAARDRDEDEVDTPHIDTIMILLRG